ncbi:transcriptional regulator/antitoxin, MazE [bacterium CPR1]|jgi:antitoxin MazE|nr:transcriptional regulator/antitoxin, MazE [bacterium CPR1]
MLAKIQKWGNSQGLRLSKDVLALAGIAVGEEVEVTVSPGEIVLHRRRPKRSLDELLEAIPEDYKPGEVDFGPPAGKEAW